MGVRLGQGHLRTPRRSGGRRKTLEAGDLSTSPYRCASGRVVSLRLARPRKTVGRPGLTHNGSNTMNYSVPWPASEKDFAMIACTNQGGDKCLKALDEVAGLLIGQGLRSLGSEPEIRRQRPSFLFPWDFRGSLNSAPPISRGIDATGAEACATRPSIVSFSWRSLLFENGRASVL